MRRLILAVLMINLILLCGCGSTARDEAGIHTLRERLQSCSALSFQMELAADDGTYVSEYKLQCCWQDDEMRMQLLEPQLISGLAAYVRDGSTLLEYDSLSLEAGTIDGESLSPIAVPAAVLEALRQGMITQVRRVNLQNECIAFRVIQTEQRCVDFWLDAQSFAPLRAELLVGERVAAICGISDWNLEEG